eukprot:8285977-Heterocapsa_arctica.AAC.1
MIPFCLDKAAPKQKGKEKKQKLIIKKFIFPKPDRRSRATKVGSVRPSAGVRGPYAWHPD